MPNPDDDYLSVCPYTKLHDLQLCRSGLIMSNIVIFWKQAWRVIPLIWEVLILQWIVVKMFLTYSIHIYVAYQFGESKCPINMDFSRKYTLLSAKAFLAPCINLQYWYARFQNYVFITTLSILVKNASCKKIHNNCVVVKQMFTNWNVWVWVILYFRILLECSNIDRIPVVL